MLVQFYLSHEILAGEFDGEVDKGLILASMLAYAGFAGIAYFVVSRTVHAAFTLTGMKL